jgi:cation transport protein ChaC
MLNRTAINSGAYLESFESLPKEILWTREQIDRSLEATLAQRPDIGDAWVFAYGSLMWNPIAHVEQRIAATLHGWHRSFCMRAIAGRGTPERPGRMLSLEPGGSTQGVALRLAHATLEDELRIIWIREMVTGAYLPTWAPVSLADGTETHAIAFVADPAHSQHECDATAYTIAPLMHSASGHFGTNADYVFTLQKTLADCGFTDPYIEELAGELIRLRAAVSR